MKTTYSEQYKRPCVIIEEDDTFDEVSEFAKDIGAELEEDGPGDWVFVAQFPDRGFPELYSPEALKGSLTPEAWKRWKIRIGNS